MVSEILLPVPSEQMTRFFGGGAVGVAGAPRNAPPADAVGASVLENGEEGKISRDLSKAIERSRLQRIPRREALRVALAFDTAW